MQSSESYVAPEQEAEKKEKVKSDLNTMKPVKKLNINKLQSERRQTWRPCKELIYDASARHNLTGSFSCVFFSLFWERGGGTTHKNKWQMLRGKTKKLLVINWRWFQELERTWKRVVKEATVFRCEIYVFLWLPHGCSGSYHTHLSQLWCPCVLGCHGDRDISTSAGLEWIGKDS